MIKPLENFTSSGFFVLGIKVKKIMNLGWI